MQKALDFRAELMEAGADWARINNFCQHPRIAGKPFARITLDELESLSVKLRSIQRKGGLQQKKDIQQPGGITYIIPVVNPTATC